MKKKFSALLLAAILCLSLIGTAFAAGHWENDPDYGPQWKADETETYTITFDANGGTISGSATMTTGTNGKLTSLPSATRSNYTFDGWYTASSGGTKVTTDTVFTSNTTVYAHWTYNGGSGNQGGGSSGGGGGGGGSSVSKKVSVNSTKNGSVSISPSYPSKGNKVTLTAKPNSGYVLDSIKVLDSKGNEIELTKVDDNKYTFIMPDGKVTVDAKFVKADGTSDASFSDVSDTHWAIKEITWAAENGIMNGIGGGQFAPDRTVTRQQLWMVMARLGGSNPADMAAARSWAMSNNISDGTRPGEALTRQQLVAILYRYANLMGYPTDGATEITTFPDHATVSDYAKDAMAWAVGNGIVAGTSDGRLNPGGTATRAQFAVIMYRFDQKFAN